MSTIAHIKKYNIIPIGQASDAILKFYFYKIILWKDLGSMNLDLVDAHDSGKSHAKNEDNYLYTVSPYYSFHSTLMHL